MFSQKLIFDTFLSSLRSLEALWGLLGGSFGRLLGSLELFRGSFRGLGGHSGALWATLGAPGEVLWFSFDVAGLSFLLFRCFDNLCIEKDVWVGGKSARLRVTES